MKYRIGATENRGDILGRVVNIESLSSASHTLVDALKLVYKVIEDIPYEPDDEVHGCRVRSIITDEVGKIVWVENAS